jgi:hypothetical protein
MAFSFGYDNMNLKIYITVVVLKMTLTVENLKPTPATQVNFNGRT